LEDCGWAHSFVFLAGFSLGATMPPFDDSFFPFLLDIPSQTFSPLFVSFFRRFSWYLLWLNGQRAFGRLFSLVRIRVGGRGKSWMTRVLFWFHDVGSPVQPGFGPKWTAFSIQG